MSELGDIVGIVVTGKRLGRTIGFPTANIDARTDWARGVYAVDVFIEGDETPHRAIINIGTHPTVPEGAPTIEAHLIGYEGDLYGKTLRVKCLRYLRPERRFGSLDQLKAQLQKDRSAASAL